MIIRNLIEDTNGTADVCAEHGLSFLAEAGYTVDRLQSMEDLKVICDCAKEKGQDGTEQ